MGLHAGMLPKWELQSLLDQQRAETERLRAIAAKAIDEWQSWVDDQLQGTRFFDKEIARVNAMRDSIALPVPFEMHPELTEEDLAAIKRLACPPDENDPDWVVVEDAIDQPAP